MSAMACPPRFMLPAVALVRGPLCENEGILDAIIEHMLL